MADAQTNGQAAAVVQYHAAAPVKSTGNLKGLMDLVSTRIRDVVPKHMSPDRLLKLVLIAANRTPLLLKCTQESVIESVMRSAELGLDCSGTLGEAYLVPYKNTKKNAYEAQFIPGYKGLAKLARQSGEIRRIEAEVVHQNDFFEYQKGTVFRLTYRPCVNDDPGEAVGAYALVEFTDGGIQAEYMSKADILKVKRMSKASSSGPWVTWEDEMWRKTVFRRLSKWLPLSSEKFNRAIELDNDTVDVSAPARFSQADNLNARLGLTAPMSEQGDDESGPDESTYDEEFGDPNELFQ